LLLSKETPYYIIEELKVLAEIIGYIPQTEVWIRKKNGKYKLSEYKIKEISKKIEDNNIEVLIVEPYLQPHSLFKLQKNIKKPVIDRTLLILEVLDKNAGSKEAKLQIQTAKLRHSLPILREALNLSKRGELPGFMAGGTYAVDRYYKHVRKKIAENRRKLELMRKRREKLRDKRRRLGFPSIAITGFANAGKTTLFNKLTKENKPVGEQPFTTVTPKASGTLINTSKVLFIDTVGFIMNVPPEIVEAFYGTLEEITASDIVLLVIDSRENQEVIKKRITESARIMAKINALHKPIIVVPNKIDSLYFAEMVEKTNMIDNQCRELYPNVIATIPISASTGKGIDGLVRTIWDYLSQKPMFSGSVIDLAETKG